MTYTNISKYIEAKKIDQQISARITNKGTEYLINGEWTKNAPTPPEFTRACMDNPDKTYII